MFEINSQNTNAGAGSNLCEIGPYEFHKSQTTVQTKIIRKNPMVPTCSVIQTASRSSLLKLSLCWTFGLGISALIFFVSTSKTAVFSVKIIGLLTRAFYHFYPQLPSNGHKSISSFKEICRCPSMKKWLDLSFHASPANFRLSFDATFLS